MSFRDIDNCLNNEGHVRGKMHFVLIVICFVGNVVIKFQVIFIGDLLLIPSPDCLFSVESLTVDGYWIVDEIGVLVNNLFDFFSLNELVLAFF